MSKPDYKLYHSSYLDTESIREAEEQIDREREYYRNVVRGWWLKLTPKQKKAEWKTDDSLIFYVDNPYKKS